MFRTTLLSVLTVAGLMPAGRHRRRPADRRVLAPVVYPPTTVVYASPFTCRLWTYRSAPVRPIPGGTTERTTAPMRFRVANHLRTAACKWSSACGDRRASL